MSENLRLLLDLASDLPDGLRADWDGTNYYDIVAETDDGGYLWLMLEDVMYYALWNAEASGPKPADRLGLLMDIAAVLKAAEPELKRLLDDD